jgi:probable F420-dependent oxidoreductase
VLSFLVTQFKREEQMQIGCSAPTSGPLIAPDSLVRIATEAEMLGFDYVTVSDHVMIPTSIASRYPYSESGEFPSGAGAARLEQLTTAAFIAAATSKLGIVTSVMVVPHRPAVLTAKILATIDYLSKGRLTLGIGAGWCKEEFEAIGAPPFEDRGHVTDEWMMACKELWAKDEPKFDGKYVKFSEVVFTPKPVQKSIPIWVGGESGPAMRRTAKYGDAWYPIGTNPQFPMDTLTRFKAGAAKLRDLTSKAGRNPSAVALAYRVSSNPEAQPKGTVDGERKLFTGSAADFAGDIRALSDAGVTSFDFGMFGPTLAATIDNMRRFKDDVVAKVK